MSDDKPTEVQRYGATPARERTSAHPGHTWSELRETFEPGDLVWDLMDRADALQAENERLRADAERFRWIATHASIRPHASTPGMEDANVERLRAAIDAARGGDD